LNLRTRYEYNYQLVSTFLASLGINPENRDGVHTLEPALKQGARLRNGASTGEILRPDGTFEKVIHAKDFLERPRERRWNPLPDTGDER